LTRAFSEILAFSYHVTRVSSLRLNSCAITIATVTEEGGEGLLSHPGFEKMKPKPLYVCPGCSNHMYSNNMVNRYNISINYRIKSYKMACGSKRRITE
jgi:hypothetical protein